MFKISIEAPRKNDGTVPTIEVEVPSVPREGEHVSHDQHEGISGYVRNVDYWWDESGKLTITVQLK